MTLPPNDGPGDLQFTGFSNVTERRGREGDIILTARTRRDGTVSSSTNFALANKREAGLDVLGRKAGHVVRFEDRKPIVTDWKGMEDYDECPPSYDQWFRQYEGYTRHLVYTMGVVPREIDDVTAEIMTRFLERDSLGEFRRDWATRSATGSSVFRSYYSRFVVTYARGKHRNNVRHVKRNALLCDAPIGDENGTTWIEQHDADIEGVGVPHYEVELASLVDSLRAQVGDDVVDAVLGLVEQESRVRLSGLASALGVSARKARTTLEQLQVAARAAIS